MSSLIQEALKIAAEKAPQIKQQLKTQALDLYELAVAAVDAASNVQPDISDKGSFGNRQIEFVQEVYYIPDAPAGDHTQPVGLITQSDLNNYVIFRKNDRLTFRYKEGTSGSSNYEAKKNGQTDFATDFDWSDALIQELIDEGACKLI